jgi:hypothetical protein
MDKAEMIWIASIAIGKLMDMETLGYSDYMYGNRDLTGEVYEYVIECRDIGESNFREKYKDYKLY